VAARDLAAHALDEDGGVLDAGLRQQRDELLTAVATQTVDVAARVPQDVCELDEHTIAGLVAVRVVDGLEAVQVEHGYRHAVARALDALVLVRQQAVDVAVVEQARQAVADAEPLQLPVLLLQLVLQPLDAQHRADPRLELGEVDGLRQVVVGASVQASHLVLRRVPRGHQDDGDERQPLLP
jgi:hypothetical protein